jgi:tetratricopeptide (TPR) repeat protein
MRYVAIVAMMLCSGTAWAETIDEKVVRLFDEGEYVKAEGLAEQSLAQAIAKHGPDHPDTAPSLNNLAELYNIQGKYDLAEPLYKRALAIDEKALGPDHPSTATSLHNLAKLYYTQGKYDLAEPLYKRALAILEKALGPDHQHSVQTRNNLAAMREARDKAASKP